MLVTKASEISSSTHFIEKNQVKAQQALLGMTAFCSILSCIPSLRFGASLAMRSISFCSVGISKPVAGKEELFIKVAKLAAIGLSMGATVASMPMLMVASLTTDIGLQIFEGVRAIYKEDAVKTGMHAMILVVDTLALGSVVLCSWQLMVAATAVSAFAMIMMASIAPTVNGHEADMGCYLVLAVTNIVTALSIGEIKGIAKTVVIKNDDSNGKLVVMKPVGSVIVAESAPGQDVTIYNNPYVRYNVLHVSSTGETRLENFRVPDQVYRAAIPSHELPGLPVGGSVLKVVESNIENYQEAI